MSGDDLKELQRLAGIDSKITVNAYEGSNVSITGMEKRRLERELGIKPGTKEWFRLWFSRPYLTGEQPVSNKK